MLPSKFPGHLAITEDLLSDTTYQYPAVCSFNKACLLNGLSSSPLLTDQLPTTLNLSLWFSAMLIMNFNFYLKTVETIVTSHRGFPKGKDDPKLLLFKPTRRACNLHSYTASASISPILNQSPGWK